MDEFQIFYSQIFTSRWEALFQSLQRPEKQIARWSAFSSSEKKQFLGGEISRGSNGLLDFYVMDPASVLAAEALQVEEGDLVLDMCAAPGGKTLVLMEALKKGGELVANEISQSRRERLTKVIQQYIPRDIRERIRVSGKDGGLFAVSHKETFDRVLVDAPCSGERHLLQHPKEMREWSLSRSKKLAQRQYALLTAALECTKPGGRIVYSTCSISTLENDKVIERLIDRKGEKFSVDTGLAVTADAEKTEYGLQFLPDHCGYGPLFYSRLIKN